MKKQNNPLREKLDAFSYDYDPNAWQAMEKKLDAQEKPKAIWWRLSPLLALLFLSLMGGIAYILLTDSAETTTKPSKERKISRLQEAPANRKAGNAISEKQPAIIGSTEHSGETPSGRMAGEENTKRPFAISKPKTGVRKENSDRPQITSAKKESPDAAERSTNTNQADEAKPTTEARLPQTERQPDQLAQLSTLAYAFEGTNSLRPGTPKKVTIIAIEEEEKPKKKPLVVRFDQEGDKFSIIPESWGIKAGTNSAITGPRDPRPEGSKERLVEDILLGMYFTYPLPGPFTLQIEPGVRSIKSLYITNQFTDTFYENVIDVETQVSSLLFYDLQLVPQLRFTHRSKFELGAGISKVEITGYGSGLSPQGPQVNGGIRDYEPPYGIRSWTYSLILGYEYKLSNRFRLSARYQRGLRDLSEPEVYTNNQRHRGSDLQLTLKFQFNKPKRETW